MTERFDLVVFGASGFTGNYVAKLLDERQVKYTVALAGRSTTKLNAVLGGLKNKSAFPLLIADVDDEASLARMCNQARVVLNCVGPFRFFGEAVVKACVSAGANYVDITGEPEFMERMEAKYNDAAREKGISIVSACGFDSIPADMGTLFTAKLFPSSGFATRIESFLTVDAGGLGLHGHYTTYESAVHGFGSQLNLQQLRRQRAAPRVTIPGPKLLPRGNLFYGKEVKAYCMPFPGADASIVRRTQSYIAAHADSQFPHPVHYAAYFTLPSLFWSIVFMMFGAVFAVLAKFAFTRKILLKYPGFFTFGMFSHEGPSEQHLRKTTFSMTFIGSGYSSAIRDDAPAPKPDCSVVARVRGPEPGYVATPIFLVDSAVTILEEKSNIPSGVITTASAFAKTALVSRLQSSGIVFEVLSKSF